MGVQEARVPAAAARVGDRAHAPPPALLPGPPCLRPRRAAVGQGLGLAFGALVAALPQRSWAAAPVDEDAKKLLAGYTTVRHRAYPRGMPPVPARGCWRTSAPTCPASTRALTGPTVRALCGLPCVLAPLRSAQLVDLIDNWEAYAGDKDEVKGDSVRRQVAPYSLYKRTHSI